MEENDVAPSRIEFRLHGTFDMPAARELCDAMICAGRVQLVIDAAHVRELHDDALAFLSRALQLVGRRVSIRGLTRHHVRLLQYLGAPFRDSGLGAPADASP